MYQLSMSCGPRIAKFSLFVRWGIFLCAGNESRQIIMNLIYSFFKLLWCLKKDLTNGIVHFFNNHAFIYIWAMSSSTLSISLCFLLFAHKQLPKWSSSLLTSVFETGPSKPR